MPSSTALKWPSTTKYQPVFESISTGRSLLINLTSYQFTSGVEFDQGYLSFFLAILCWSVNDSDHATKKWKRHKKLAFLSCTNLTQVSTPLVSIYKKKEWALLFHEFKCLSCVHSLWGEIETRWDEKFFNIEWRLGTWGGLWVVRKTIAMWAAALLSGSPNYLSIQPPSISPNYCNLS